MIHLKLDQPSDPLRSIVLRTNSLNVVLSTKTKRKSHSKQAAAMSQFWKPGTEKPRLLDDEEGGVVFLSSSLSSASSIGYQSHTKLCTQKHTFLYVFFFLYAYVSVVLDMVMPVLRNRGRDCPCTSTVQLSFIWWRLMLLLLLLVRLVAAKPLRFLRSFFS